MLIYDKTKNVCSVTRKLNNYLPACPRQEYIIKGQYFQAIKMTRLHISESLMQPYESWAVFAQELLPW